MATPDFTAGQVMDASAALLNDVAKAIYTYAAQIPYLNMAARELQQIYQQNDIPVTVVKSDEIAVPAGQTTIAFNAVAPAPSLPDDLVEPQQLWEKATGSDQSYTSMQRLTQLPEYLEDIVTNMFINWAWNDQEIKLPEANADNVVRIDYLKALFTTLADENSVIGVVNAQSFLEYRTAALCAQYIGENPSRAQVLNNDAAQAMDRLISLSAKGRQSIVTRRKPFRSGYKTRGW